jgi:hypothetical protein
MHRGAAVGPGTHGRLRLVDQDLETDQHGTGPIARNAAGKKLGRSRVPVDAPGGPGSSASTGSVS